MLEVVHGYVSTLNNHDIWLRDPYSLPSVGDTPKLTLSRLALYLADGVTAAGKHDRPRCLGSQPGRRSTYFMFPCLVTLRVILPLSSEDCGRI